MVSFRGGGGGGGGGGHEVAKIELTIGYEQTFLVDSLPLKLPSTTEPSIYH